MVVDRKIIEDDHGGVRVDVDMIWIKGDKAIVCAKTDGSVIQLNTSMRSELLCRDWKTLVVVRLSIIRIETTDTVSTAQPE